MIDPITALAAVSSAVNLVKKAVATVQDVQSLGPVLSKYFDAKAQAIEVVEKSKTGTFKGSSLGKALELEMALEQARAFEEELKMLFMQTGKIDVWNKIKARQAEMDRDDAKEMAALRAQEKKQKEEDAEQMAWLIGGLAVVALLAFMAFAITELRDVCAHGRCGR